MHATQRLRGSKNARLDPGCYDQNKGGGLSLVTRGWKGLYAGSEMQGKSASAGIQGDAAKFKGSSEGAEREWAEARKQEIELYNNAVQPAAPSGMYL